MIDLPTREPGLEFLGTATTYGSNLGTVPLYVSSNEARSGRYGFDFHRNSVLMRCTYDSRHYWFNITEDGRTDLDEVSAIVVVLLPSASRPENVEADDVRYLIDELLRSADHRTRTRDLRRPDPAEHVWGRTLWYEAVAAYRYRHDTWPSDDSWRMPSAGFGIYWPDPQVEAGLARPEPTAGAGPSSVIDRPAASTHAGEGLDTSEVAAHPGATANGSLSPESISLNIGDPDLARTMIGLQPIALTVLAGIADGLPTRVLSGLGPGSARTLAHYGIIEPGTQPPRLTGLGRDVAHHALRLLTANADTTLMGRLKHFVRNATR